jgi:dephospho-CoA kinase
MKGLRAMKVVGLTGGIACGKSTVSAMFQASGAPVVDADRIARKVVAPGSPAFKAIVERFGASVVGPDGDLDRRAMGRTVFGDTEARGHLERITHPEIRAASISEMQRLEAEGHRLAFYEASLLVETGRHRDMDALVVVVAREEIRRLRLIARDRLSEAEVLSRMSAQLPAEDKALLADFVIDNSGSVQATERQARGVLRLLNERFSLR